MAWPEGWTDRVARQGDAARVVRLMNARSEHLSGCSRTTLASVLSWWKKPGFVLEDDLYLFFDPDGGLAAAAFVDAEEPYANVDCSAVVHPNHEANARLWDCAHAWALGRAAAFVQLAPAGIRVAALAHASSQDEAGRAALRRAEYDPARLESRMRIDLASAPPKAVWPAGVAVRAADLGRDVPAIVDLYREAWRDHWGFVERPRADVLATFVSEIESRCGAIDPTLWFLAVAESEVVGMALCISGLEADPTGGYIYLLGVGPAQRRRGVGLALLHHAFGEFRRRGYAGVELDVDSESLTGALALYERAGMRAIRQTVTYERVLRPGVDLATRELPAQSPPQTAAKEARP